jgi:hypothetical protein
VAPITLPRQRRQRYRHPLKRLVVVYLDFTVRPETETIFVR